MHEKSPPALWSGQPLHLLCLACLLGQVWFGWDMIGQPQALAFWTAISLPVVHQVYVWLTWRLELGASAVSRVMGFRVYLVIFFVLFGGRFVSLAVLGWVDSGSLGMGATARIVLTGLLALPGIYALYSVQRYFGLKRAAGADHFFESYRDKPLVKEGIFRFTSNGMYVYAFLLFWAIAVSLDSAAALVVVAFSHLYIWVHYHALEKTDMDFLHPRGQEISNA